VLYGEYFKSFIGIAEGVAVKLRFALGQHIRDTQLLNSFVSYLECGNLFKGKEAVVFVVMKFSDLTDKIISFFEKYSIHGVKAKEFEDFKKVAKLMGNKAHLTDEGLKIIKEIQSGMNRGRKN